MAGLHLLRHILHNINVKRLTTNAAIMYVVGYFLHSVYVGNVMYRNWYVRVPRTSSLKYMCYKMYHWFVFYFKCFKLGAIKINGYLLQ